MILAVLQRALGDIRASVNDLEPDRLTGGDAARLLSVFAALERTIVAGKTLVASRAADGGAWREEGHRSPASWVAEKTGTGLGEAIGVLETSERLLALPETTGALRRGELSGPQLKEIAATAAQNPEAERELLEAALGKSFKGLKDHCRRVRGRSASEKEARARYEEIRKNRYLLTWTDIDGAGRLEAKLTPDDMARFNAAIQSETNAVYEVARKAGHREPTVAYAADALMALVTDRRLSRSEPGSETDVGSAPAGGSGRSRSGPGSGSGSPTTVMHLRVDLAALRRGSLESDERCEIPGVGSVPLATAVNEFGNAILKVVITDGVDVRTVCHLGRAIPNHIRTALEERDEVCVVPGCDVAKGLEIDHYQVAFADDGPTELWNLCRLCHWHHYLKTHGGYAVTGEPGSWQWRAPPSTENPILTC